MTNTAMIKKGIAGSSVAVVFLVVLANALPAGMLMHCDIGDCEPFTTETTADRIEATEENAAATGIASQLFYGTYVGDIQMRNAVRMYAYCEEGPGEPGEYPCEDMPDDGEMEEDIVTTVENFRPYPQDFQDTIRDLLPISDSLAFDFTVQHGGETILESGMNRDSVTGDTATFLFVEPVPGGEHVTTRFEVNEGRMLTGVREE